MKIKFIIIPLLMAIVASSLFSCKKFIDPGLPETGLVKASVFEHDATANGAVLGIYYNLMYNGSMQDYSGIGSETSLYSDELRSHSSPGSTQEVYNDALISTSSIPGLIWQNIYTIIYQINSAIEGLSASTTLTPATRDRLLSEVKCMRAYLYFNLVNIYGDVPLIMRTDYEKSRLASRDKTAAVYTQILKDLNEAKQTASDSYTAGDGTITSERIRVNLYVIEALLARVYLYTKDYTNAEKYATLLIENNQFHLESDLNQVFLNTSHEAIWQLKPQDENFTWEGWNYILTAAPSTGGQHSNTLSDTLLHSFSNEDNRKSAWIGSVTVNATTYYFPYKYKSFDRTATGNEYLMVIRLAEMYLIRAEARAELGQLTGTNSAATDLYTIRSRAGMTKPITASSYTDIMRLIAQERKRELFTESAHRFFDLKRWKGLSDPGKSRIDEVMPGIAKIKGGQWEPYKKYFPIPKSERLKDPNLSQNEGYSN